MYPLSSGTPSVLFRNAKNALLYASVFSGVTLSKLIWSLDDIPLRLKHLSETYQSETECGIKGPTEREKLIVLVGNQDVFLRFLHNVRTELRL